ncbi:hypothetical protein GPAL_3878 [Glaciecola pallidula DSM 14239 = ACAM 615]|uniref:Uncharacterized protein n=1 Tax=Brumicola pallidula DSM 14239 = ACAM 615 TaxID=1121922 RepID=K6ZPA9_9ALTE|nr:hypothetical protein GPAL_3878 [Glaciecola pallidula DSM 14239 = ACAM 615]
MCTSNLGPDGVGKSTLMGLIAGARNLLLLFAWALYFSLLALHYFVVL